ncbi:non-ribosomal peptide synthetase [Clostridium tyrobutyricum]|uniref:non-ribosomal peptide synthetase n=1 Tax=Clostridium tyrobutyricum TaxID=1519 RepID=UPI001C37FB6C|nr:non-ribosomal peptide synthetase [Clostridium tyrobutyricum]MBV4429415.1 amino acid adenylation domain-containing protein [Clostridium tyrobutyricum]MBV4444637.1 amino acid adenylation domain-containing protein [Clostridium tyrobutyricum]
MKYTELKEQICKMMPQQCEIADTDNLLEKGLNSLKIMRIVNQWRKQGIKVSFGELMEDPTAIAWWNMIQEMDDKKTVRSSKKQEKIRCREPFPLTDMQYAYWIGRGEDQTLGGVGCHAYLEFDGEGVDPERLEQAWNIVQNHHSMLRARFLDDGTQEIMEKPYDKHIKVNDYRNALPECIEELLLENRNELSHRKLYIENGEVSGICLSLLPDNKSRIHFDIDLLVADVQSLQIILRDLATAYNGECLPESSKTWNFEDYLRRLETDDREERQRSKIYWQDRLASLPAGPDLPLAKHPEEIETIAIKRRICYINAEEWELLQKRVSEYQTTPAMLLLSAYATILERWSINKKFLISIPLFNRRTEFDGIENAIADFTTLVLLEVDCEENPTFIDLLRKIQKQMHRDMQYSKYSGIQVQRDLARVYEEQINVAPVVFACNLGNPLVDQRFVDTLGHFGYMISQTPQVWMDFQSYEYENGLMLTWDTVDELFPKNMIDDMMESFGKLLRSLVTEKWNQKFDVLPDSHKKFIEEQANIKELLEPRCIHEAFMKWSRKTPDATALIDTGKNISITYEELKEKVQPVAAAIIRHGIKNEPVAITLPRGYEQIEAALAILLSGNFYVPVSGEQPEERRKLIHEKTGIKFVITNEEMGGSIQWDEDVEIFYLADMEKETVLAEYPTVSPDSSAYIIMTSGTTGLPKGVEIAHKSAWNTISDINKKFEVNENDIALAVSAMDFDLSVYDVFGILGAGGTLVLIPDSEKRNSEYWLQQVIKYQVTVWNSVPILMEMLLISAGTKKKKLPIRIAMLSGDWISMDLPQKAKKMTNECVFVAMGGATEASIWSNYQVVSLPIPEKWKSIPYGVPLNGQVYRVVDCKGNDCPYWVEGELWIGGHGIAKGYRGDLKLTKEKFIVDEKGRWYCTGDKGRFWDNGIIEFLGRKDNQVKIRGHRIEIGEIENALCQFSDIDNVVVDVILEKHGEKYLAAFIEGLLNESSVITKILQTDGRMESLWKYVLEEKMVLEEDIQNKYCEFMEYAKLVCIEVVKNIFVKMGLPHNSMDSIYSINEILHMTSIQFKWKAVIERWIKMMVDSHVFFEKVEGYSWDIQQMDYEKKYEKLDNYIIRISKYIPQILTGKIEAVQAYYGSLEKVTPNDILMSIPGNEKLVSYICHIIKQLRMTNNMIRVLEIGTRDSEISMQIQNCLDGMDIDYCYVDTSKYFVDSVRAALNKYENIECKILDFDKANGKLDIESNKYDLVIAYNSLHRTRNIEKMLKNISCVTAPGGILCIQELTEETYLQEIVAALLEDGFVSIEDIRKKEAKAIFDSGMWDELIHDSDFCESVIYPDFYGRTVIWAKQKKDKLVFTSEKINESIAKKLPEYMIPRVYQFVEQFPTSQNGKIDRKALKNMVLSKKESGKNANAVTNTEKKLLQIWKDIFERKDIGVIDNYFSLGGDSLVATRLIASVQKEFSCKISIAKIFEKPTVRELAREIEITECLKEKLPEIQQKPEQKNLPFPLTDVQYAYWIGRNGLYDLGNVSTHCYFELDADNISFEKVQAAFNMLISKHGMMRVVIQDDGQQRIMDRVPEYKIEITDVSMFSQSEKERKLEIQRESMSHEVIDTNHWPPFEIKITKKSNAESRIHISFDNIIFDGWSMFHILNEWEEAYKGTLPSENIEISFRDYVLGLEEIKKTSRYAKDEKYWKDRIESFLPAPELPLAKRESDVKHQKFKRRTARLSHKEWDDLKKFGGTIGVTPSALLIAAYAEVLRLWSVNDDFTINLTQFNRIPIHPDVNRLVGDFTTLTLLEVPKVNDSSFSERCVRVQQQLAQDMEHSFYSAIEVERKLKKQNGNIKGSIMPIVFTSGLGVEQWNDGKWLGKLVYNISQTPQVWLDHQVVEMDGELCLFWDSVDELFYPGMLDEMFTTYVKLLKNIAADSSVANIKINSLVSATISKERYAANNTYMSVEEDTLDGMFIKMCYKYPDKEAVVANTRRLTYNDVAAEASFLCEELNNKGVQKGDIVGIIMDKGWEQVVAVYGILFAGAVYLPIDVNNPEERIKKILINSEAKVVLIQPEVIGKQPWLCKWEYITVHGEKSTNLQKVSINNASDKAYVIYTSGTTGMPKGVGITHHGAVNTIKTINFKYNIGTSDKAFCISNLHFDLSVFDVFGLLGAGAALVIPDYKKVKEPAYWVDVINTEHITVWNSVPAFMEMLVEYEEHQKKVEFDGLRIVLMSGDWIPLTLPNRITNIFNKAQLISLGGATEASIWSNDFTISTNIPREWKSIPYGKPLANQKFYILNKNLQDCPDWVPGMLYIAGEGLAEGYFNDEAKTVEKFNINPNTGERIYCTGDIGRYWNDGNIEFLGRMDSQVKFNGYRIELGEIEGIICSFPNINKSKVLCVTYQGKKFLVAFYYSSCKVGVEDLNEYLNKFIPSYMVPSYLIFLKEFPKTTNGKIDSVRLKRMAKDCIKDKIPKIEKSMSEEEKKLSLIWGEVLAYEEISLDDDFFTKGGDSLRAIRLVNEISKNYGVEISVRDIFKYSTLLQLTKFIEAKKIKSIKNNINDEEEGYF